MRTSKLFFLIASAMLLLATSASLLTAQEGQEGVFIPIGAGYGDTYDGLLERIIAASTQDTINILVLASAYSTNSDEISEEERTQNTADAEERRLEIEEACTALAEGKTCVVTLAPIFTREDALAPEALALFIDNLDAVYILGGDQAIAMEILAGSPVEEALARIHASGTIITGTSAGNAVQSRTMIGGYVGDFGPETGLNNGAVDIWDTDERRGLSFGLDNVVLDQHFFQRARLGRLLNVIAQPDVPHVGVGVDAYTAAVISNRETVGDVFGLYTVAVADAETFKSYETAQYVGDIVSIRNVLLHLLAPGDSTYNLMTRAHSLAAPPESISRSFDDLNVPEGAGTLLLAGNLIDFFADSPILARFDELSGGSAGNILIVAAGFADAERAQTMAFNFSAAFGGASEIVILGKNTPAPEGDYTGIVIVGDDKSLIDPTALAAVLGDRWQNGTPVLADHAAAGVLGAFYANHGPTPEATDDDPFADENAIQGSFINGATEVVEGLGWINANIETSLLYDYRLGRWFSVAYAHPDLLALGLTDGTAVEISSEEASVLGANGIFVLDLRGATLSLGENDGFVIANGLIDVFAPGEVITALDAAK